MTDYERGVEQASSIYREVIREYVAENDKLRELVRDMWRHGMCACEHERDCVACQYAYPGRMQELGIEVSDS